jgi:nitrilase
MLFFLQFGATVGSRSAEGRSWFRRYYESSVPVCNVEGEEMRAIRAAATDNNVTLVVGVIERCNEASTGPAREVYGSSNTGGSSTLYCEECTFVCSIPPLPSLLTVYVFSSFGLQVLR